MDDVRKDICYQRVERAGQRAVGRGVLTDEEQVRPPVLGLLRCRIGIGVHRRLQLVEIPGSSPRREGGLGFPHRGRYGLRQGRRRGGRERLQFAFARGDLGRAVCELPLIGRDFACP